MNKKTKELYKNNPEVISYIAIEDGKLVIDINEEKTTISEIVLVYSNIINEYIRTAVKNTTEQTQQPNEKENANGKK